MATATKALANGNGAAQAAESLEAAMAHEQGIADEAARIRGDAIELTPALFMQLWPLLKRPIPPAFIQTVGVVTGKPYESTGIKSVQVQIDRMNNVLTPMWWREKVTYEHDGKLAHVTVIVGSDWENALLSRKSAGGVDRGSTIGNVHKGSYTNAAKLAFARIGVGHEVYLGAADLDPDTNQQAADVQAVPAGKSDDATVGNAIAKKLVDRTWEVEGAKAKFRLAVSHAAGKDVGDIDTKAKATKAVAALTFPQAEQLDRWIAKKERGDE